MGLFSKIGSFIKENAHTILDVAGMIPGIGAVADLANAGLYAAEGDWVNAGLSAVSAIPGVGDTIALANKGMKVAKGAKAILKGGKGVKTLLKAGGKTIVKAVKGKMKVGAKLLKKLNPKKLFGGFKNGFKKIFLEAKCFTGDTLVYTEKGMVPIKEVKAGDLIYAKNEETGEVGLKRVERTSETVAHTIYRITIDNRETVETTGYHGFYTEGLEWVNAINLKVGDKLISEEGTRCITSVEKTRSEEAVSVYNFVVEEWHTFFVTEGKICVHNSLRHLLKKGKDKLTEAYTKVKDMFKKRCKSDPVDVVTGIVFNENIDFELPGVIPVIWERKYYSDNKRSGILGYGTCLNYETKLLVSEKENAIALLLTDGRAVKFGLDLINGSEYNRTEKLTLSEENGIYKVYNHKENLFYIYESKDGFLGVFYLTQIRDFAGHQIKLIYKEGNLEHLVDSVGRTLMIHNDDHGRIIEVTLGTKTLVSYGYSPQGDLVIIKDALRQKKTIEYKNHLMTKATTKDGYTFHWEYEENGSNARCIHSWGEDGTLEYYFEYMDGVSYNTNALGYREEVYFNDLNLITKVIDSEGDSKEYEYNEYEELVSVTDAMGNKTTFVYDERGNVSEFVRPSGAKTKYKHNQMGWTTKVIYPNGGELKWMYNENGKVDKCIQADGSETKYNYNKNNLLSEMDDALGNKTRFSYDNWGNLKEVQQADGNKSEFEYDEYGNCKKVINPLGGEQSMEHDALGRITRINMPDGNIINMKYNGHNEVIMVKDKQRTVNYEYTWFGKLKKRKELDRIQEFIYDKEEQLKLFVNGKKETYKFEYDGKGNVIEEVGFDGLKYGYIYNKAGWLESVKQPGGKEKSFKYDKDGNIIQIQYAEGNIERFKYNQMGSLLEAINNDSSIVIELDIMERVKKVTQDGHVIESEYDKLGQRILLKSSIGAYIEQEYNQRGNLNQIKASTKEGKGWVTKFKHNSLGQEISRTMPGGGYSEWEYDKTGRPIIQVIKGADDKKNTRSYMWDTNYQLKLRTCDSSITKYNYDEYGNLAWSDSDTETIFRSMDEVGNIYKTKDHLDREYGNGGRLLRSDRTSYEYDEQGNLCEKKIGDCSWKFKYDDKGLMSKVILPDGKKVTFRYDALGRRIEKSFEGKKIKFLWNGDVILHEWEIADDKLEEFNTWIFDEKILSPIAKISQEKIYSVISDYLGTPIKMFNENNELVWENEMDIFGKSKNSNDITCRCKFRFPGQYEDVESGLYYNRFRYYSPEDGLYTQQDPIGVYGENPSIYGYVYNTLISTDVYGLYPIYRSMTDVNSKPSSAHSARGLGARPDIDIPVDPRGNVAPKTGGISASPKPEDLPKHRKPPKYGGTGSDPVWTIDSEDLGDNLKYEPDSAKHGTIQPTKEMSMDEYQKELKNLEDKWSKVC